MRLAGRKSNDQKEGFSEVEDAASTRLDPAFVAKLKGSIGEGSNHSNFAHQSSVTILSKIQYILLEN